MTKRSLLALLFLMYFFSFCKENISKENSKVEKLVHKSNKELVEAIAHYPDGKIKIKGQLLNNKREGIWRSFYPNGVKQSESFYTNGFLEGNTTAYYENSMIRYSGFYIKGKKHGKWVFNDKNQIEKKEIWYENGKLKD